MNELDIERHSSGNNDFENADFETTNFDGMGEEFFINTDRQKHDDVDPPVHNNYDDGDEYPKNFSDNESMDHHHVSHSPVHPNVNTNLYNDNSNQFREPQRSYVSPEEELQEKKQLLYQFERLDKKGIPVKKFNLNSDLNEMKWEYDRIKNQIDSEKANANYKKGLIVFTNIIEILNSKFDPFDIKLDGWSESVNDDIEEYDDVFEELHDKYRGKVKIAPEIKLLGLLAGSGFMYNFQQASLRNSNIPGADEILKSDPELMKQFNKAAANSSSYKQAQKESNPMVSMMGNLLGGGGNGGLGGLMGGLMGGGNQAPAPPPRQPNMQPPNLNVNELLGGHASHGIDINDDEDRVSDIISLSGVDFDDEEKHMNQTSFNPKREALLNKMKNRKKGRGVEIDI